MVNYGLGEELLQKHRSVFDGQHGVLKGLKQNNFLRKMLSLFLRRPVLFHFL